MFHPPGSMKSLATPNANNAQRTKGRSAMVRLSFGKIGFFLRITPKWAKTRFRFAGDACLVISTELSGSPFGCLTSEAPLKKRHEPRRPRWLHVWLDRAIPFG